MKGWLPRARIWKIEALTLAVLLCPIGCVTTSSSTATPAHTLIQLLANEVDSVDDSAINAQRAEKLCQLAKSENWRLALRMYDISEADFVALPPKQRDARRAEDLKRVGEVNRIVQTVLARAQRFHADGKLAKADELSTCIRRLIDANSGPNVLALANMVARGIEKRLADSGL